MESVAPTLEQIQAGISLIVKVTPDEAEKVILNIGSSKFVLVEFIKRTTGDYRRMVCRVGVTKHLKGGPPAYDPRDYRLVWVWEPGVKGGYKSIPKDNIMKIVCGHVCYDVVREENPHAV